MGNSVRLCHIQRTITEQALQITARFSNWHNFSVLLYCTICLNTLGLLYIFLKRENDPLTAVGASQWFWPFAKIVTLQQGFRTCQDLLRFLGPDTWISCNSSQNILKHSISHKALYLGVQYVLEYLCGLNVLQPTESCKVTHFGSIIQYLVPSMHPDKIRHTSWKLSKKYYHSILGEIWGCRNEICKTGQICEARSVIVAVVRTAEHNKSGPIRTRDIYYVRPPKSDFIL